MSSYEDTWKSLKDGEEGDKSNGEPSEKMRNHEFVATNADRANLTPEQQYSVAWGPDAVNADWVKKAADELTAKINADQSTEILRKGAKREDSSATNGQADKVAGVTQSGSSAGRPGFNNPSTFGSSRAQDGNPDWSNKTDAEKAAWYSENPTFGKITELGQKVFGMTEIGQFQKSQVPDFVERQALIARGIDPDKSFGIQSDDGLKAINAADRGYTTDDAPGVQQEPSQADRDAYNSLTGQTESGGESSSVPSLSQPGEVSQSDRDAYNSLVSQSENYSNEGRNSESSSSSSSSGGSSRVICTHFYRKGEIDRDVWRADLFFTAAHLSAVTIRGYQFWGIPYVRLMRKSKRAENIMRPIALHRAQELAHKMGVKDKDGNLIKSSWRGKLVRLVMEPLCFTIGLFVGQQDWQSLWADVNTKGA